MPIPTRSISIRDSRKQPANVGRPVSSKRSSGTTTPADDTSSNTTSSTDRTPSQTKSRLPAHDGKPVVSQQSQDNGRLSQRASRLLQKGHSQKTQAQSPAQEHSTILSRRQSLIRPSQLKAPSTSKSTTTPTTSTRGTIARGPPSPLKLDNTPKHNGRALSPKKTDMAPPPRPTRSASLRQPASSSSGTSTASRGHTRHRSQVVIPASTQTPKAQPPTPTTATPTTSTTSRIRRFTTNQQQFSSKKPAAKPPTPVPSTTAPRDLDSSMIPSTWPEIAALQTELLQLSILHSFSLQRNDDWEADAETQLRSNYDSVAGEFNALIDIEKESQRNLNGKALHLWLVNSCEHSGEQAFAKQIQVLSQIAQDVYDLSDSSTGRYTMVAQGFEKWHQKVETIRNSRSQKADGHQDFIDSLDDKWKEEARLLTLKLELSFRQLQSLDILRYEMTEPLNSSAPLRTARGLDEIVRLMIEELSAMSQIEAEIVKSERARVSQLAQGLAATQIQDEIVPRVGMWRRSSLKS